MNDRSVSHQSRRADLAERSSEETGIDGPMIDVLVRRFYEKVRADALLGLIFETRISDWKFALKAHVRVLVPGGVDDGTLSRNADGQTFSATRRRRTLRPLARSLRGDGARNVLQRPPITLSSARGVSPKAWRSELPGSTTPFSREGSVIGSRLWDEWAMDDLATWAERVEVIDGCRCIGCGRVEASRPCVGICQDRRARLVELDNFVAALERAENSALGP